MHRSSYFLTNLGWKFSRFTEVCSCYQLFTFTVHTNLILETGKLYWIKFENLICFMFSVFLPFSIHLVWQNIHWRRILNWEFQYFSWLRCTVSRMQLKFIFLIKTENKPTVMELHWLLFFKCVHWFGIWLSNFPSALVLIYCRHKSNHTTHGKATHHKAINNSLCISLTLLYIQEGFVTDLETSLDML
jgi:hypothetical protein